MPRKRKSTAVEAAGALDVASGPALRSRDSHKREKTEKTETSRPAEEASDGPPFTALPLRHVDRLIEPGPILLVSTGQVADQSHNLMTLGFHMMVQHSGPTLLAVCLGPWDASFARLRALRQCVLAIPSGEAIAETVVDIGNCSADDEQEEEEEEEEGEEDNDKIEKTDRSANKWTRFGFTPLPAAAVKPPLVGGPDIMANIECVVHDDRMVGRSNIWILKAVRAWWREDMVQNTGRMLHHRGKGIFSVSGGPVVDMSEHMTKWADLA